MIRGKGATKEGKLGRAGLPQPGEDEPLHALITGNTPESVKAAVDKVTNYYSMFSVPHIRPLLTTCSISIGDVFVGYYSLTREFPPTPHHVFMHGAMCC